jgi:hypothetical protein
LRGIHDAQIASLAVCDVRILLANIVNLSAPRYGLYNTSVDQSSHEWRQRPGFEPFSISFHQ